MLPLPDPGCPGQDSWSQWSWCVLGEVALTSASLTCLCPVTRWTTPPCGPQIPGPPGAAGADAPASARRCSLASLLTIALHGKLEYYTGIMKELLVDLIDASAAKNPKLMLRRTESVVEKMLTNWMSICMYSCLRVRPLGQAPVCRAAMSLPPPGPASPIGLTSFYPHANSARGCVDEERGSEWVGQGYRSPCPDGEPRLRRALASCRGQSKPGTGALFQKIVFSVLRPSLGAFGPLLWVQGINKTWVWPWRDSQSSRRQVWK